MDWLIAGQIYFLGFVIALAIACVIKLMLVIIRKTDSAAAAKTAQVQAAAPTEPIAESEVK